MIKFFHSQNKQAIQKESSPAGSPDVDTLSADELQAQDTPTLRFKLAIIDEGDSSITEKGIYYAKHNNPGPSDTKTNSSTGGTPPIFEYEVDNLDFYTIYYFKAFATNSQGTGYGVIKMALTQSDGIVSELWHENVTSTTVDFGVLFTKFYILEVVNISQIELYLTTDGSPQDSPPVFYLGQDDLAQDDLPKKSLKINFGTLIPNTTYYYTAGFTTTAPGWNRTPNYYGIRSFTTPSS